MWESRSLRGLISLGVLDFINPLLNLRLPPFAPDFYVSGQVRNVFYPRRQSFLFGVCDSDCGLFVGYWSVTTGNRIDV